MGRIGTCGALALSIAIVFGSGEAARARPPGGGPGGPAPDDRRLEGLVDQLGLDADTLAAVDEVLDASRIRARTLRRELRAAHESMRALLDAEEPAEADVYSQVDVISDLEGALQKNRLGTLLRVRALLPPESRAQLLELMQRRREGRPPPRRGRW